VHRCDITDADSCNAAAAEAEAAHGAPYALINLAGGSGPIGKTGVDTTRDEFHDILDLNTTGIFNAIRAVAPAMMAAGRGRIVNVGGTFGMRGRAGRLAYSASKWGLRGVTKSFALELGPHGITVNTVAPGMVDGPRFREKVCADMAARRGHHRWTRQPPPRRRLRAGPRVHRAGRGQCLRLPRLRRRAPDHGRRPARRWRLGSALMTPKGHGT
jgi:NAD(P)-dependent dehydrogenase (short-subunit alcohol dehydrogenase family)